MINHESKARELKAKYDRLVKKLLIAVDIDKKIQKFLPKHWITNFRDDTETYDISSSTATITAVTEFNEICKHIKRITNEPVIKESKVKVDGEGVYLSGDGSKYDLIIWILQFKPEKQCKIIYKDITIKRPVSSCLQDSL